ncbi:hypothetical protein [Pelosinus sp. IPA-1]|uniref:DUF7336 domain-containing protein n=1 Tax=Pelosinus sp. IPA-1 TaxID=3029569 RepID=UPI00243616CC|nr:hypothetical protein [Pelosinus sp. IPA-1]GMA99469.1 hypothetical protein PIPA1_22690 [Pelosinus sp. IPA-1]
MAIVYLLQHSYEIETKSGIFDETKLIGIFSSKEKAEKAIKKFLDLRTTLRTSMLISTNLIKGTGKKVLLLGGNYNQCRIVKLSMADSITHSIELPNPLNMGDY